MASFMGTKIKGVCRAAGSGTMSPERSSRPGGGGAMPDLQFDPLAAARSAEGPDVDLFVSGPVCLDIIFTGLESAPKGGVEIWAEGMGSCPGGIANLAVAARRLGLRTSLASAFGDDDYGDFCWRTLSEQEQV